MSNRPKPVVLIVLDGWGYSKNSLGNAIQGHSPNLERYFEEYPHTFLKTSGEAVGLPEGQMGNSEVGHMNLGAGFVVYQQFVKIDVAIRDGSFFHNPALTAAIDHAKKTGGNLHLMGLTGTGGVHAHSRHLYALLKLAHDAGLGAALAEALRWVLAPNGSLSTRLWMAAIPRQHPAKILLPTWKAN